jgi:hypothetical protein
MQGHPEFTYEVSNWITLNRTVLSQTSFSVAKSSCEICALFQYYVVLGDNTNVLGQYININFKEIQKGEHCMTEVN